MGPMAGLDGCGKYRSHTGIRSPDRPARSEALYRLSYRGLSQDYRMEDNGFSYQSGHNIVPFSKKGRPAMGPTQRPLQWLRGDLPSGIKRSGDRSQPSSVGLKNEWRFNSTPLLRCFTSCRIL